MTTTDAETHTLGIEALTDHASGVLEASGLSSTNARLVAESLVDAEARGVGSHGLTRLRIYSERLRKLMADPNGTPEVTSVAGGTVRVDAHNAIGQIGAQFGVDVAMDLARMQGIAIAGIRNSNHCGTLAFFTRRIAEAGLIAIAMSTAPPTMVYFGGRTRAVGTNPISMAVPRSGANPIVIDMATSATARGKIILAHQTGAGIPPGWAVDVAGRPTTDPELALAGSVLPFAGPKGSGLAMMVDLLCGALVGGVTGAEIGDMYEDWNRTQRVSHVFIVIDPAVWQDPQQFTDTVARFADTVGELPPADGHERVLLPGEIEDAALARAVRDGIAVPTSVLDDLTALATEVGLDSSLDTVSIRP